MYADLRVHQATPDRALDVTFKVFAFDQNTANGEPGIDAGSQVSLICPVKEAADYEHCRNWVCVPVRALLKQVEAKIEALRGRLIRRLRKTQIEDDKVIDRIGCDGLNSIRMTKSETGLGKRVALGKLVEYGVVVRLRRRLVFDDQCQKFMRITHGISRGKRSRMR